MLEGEEERELKGTTVITWRGVKAKRHHSIMFMCALTVYMDVRHCVSPSQRLDRPGDLSKASFSLFPQDFE